MSRLVEARLMDFGLGLNDGVGPAQIKVNEVSAIKNLYPYQMHLRRRRGRLRLTNTAATEDITGIYAMKRTAGAWTLLCGLQSGFSRVSGALFVPLTDVGNGTALVGLGANSSPWVMKQYKNLVYAVRSDRPGILRITEDSFGQAGISAPSTAPTLTEVASAGNVDAGDYYGVVTFVNLDTDVESNPSDPSAICTLASAYQIAWSNIPVSTNPQVNGRRLYRVLPDQQGEYYLVDTIADNTSTTYTDNLLLEELGGQASYRYGLPPSSENLIDIEEWRERIWVISKNGLSYSEEFLPECFSASAYIEVTPDDGHSMRAVQAFGDRLVWGKTNSVGFVTGTGPADFSIQVLDDRNGVISTDSMRVGDGFIFWYSGLNVFQSDGSSVRPISDPKVRTILDSVPEAYKHTARGAIYPRLGWYLLSVPTGTSATPTKLLVYNYRNQAWSVFDYSDESPQVMGDFFDAQLEPRIYGAFSGVRHVFDLTEETQLKDDSDTPGEAAANMTASFRTKALDFGQTGNLHAIKNVGVMCPDTGVLATMRLYRDQEETASKVRSDVPLYSNNGRRWKRGALSALGRKSYTTAFELEYTGEADITIEGVELSAMVWNWKEQPK